MKVSKAVITAAGESQRHLPLQTVVDGHGRQRKVLGLLVDEVASAGVEEVGIIIRPGFEDLYRDVADDVSVNLSFIIQPEPRGYADAVLCARDFVGDHTFMLMVSDHVYVSDAPNRTCAQQLVAIAEQEECVVSAVQPTHESKLPYFGAIGGNLFDRERELYEVNAVLEKPTPTAAEQQLVTPGLRHGHYLCFLGMHVLNALFIETLCERTRRSASKEQHLSGALNDVAGRGRYLALAIDGRRYDLDRRHGLLIAQLAVGLSGDYREEVLESLVEVLAQSSAAQSKNA
ncbi:MAG: sugar phosphate nucleotidyltransferase [Verrucomicrobia bacterium]|nr:sugar phosphate nucleotidyltransferase [Verrucomicrobiota bacterium]